MKKTIIAMVLTLLLGPGTGHLYLKRYGRGMIFINVGVAAKRSCLRVEA